MLDALCWFAWLNAEGSCTFSTFLGKYALRFPNSGNCFGITGQSFLLIPGDTVITAP
jgi:hypothetical protein